jgi:hypothetical protein
LFPTAEGPEISEATPSLLDLITRRSARLVIVPVRHLLT